METTKHLENDLYLSFGYCPTQYQLKISSIFQFSKLQQEFTLKKTIT